MYIENPPSVTEETRWMYAQLLRLLEQQKLMQEEIDALKEKLAMSEG